MGEDREKERLLWLDFGKAAGILVVLLVHAECALGPVTYYGGMFYMPVFFVAAGYTYRRREGERLVDFFTKKARRLLVPYVTASGFLWLFFWVKDSLLGGNPADIRAASLWGILYSRNQCYTMEYAGNNPVLLDILNAPLWFLSAMFLTYLWYELITRSGKKMLLLALGLIASMLWHYSTMRLLFWSLDAVPYFACYLWVGEQMRKKEGEKLLGELWFLGVLSVVFLFSSNLNGSVNLSCGNYGHSMILCLLAGSSGSLLVFAAGMWLEKRYAAAAKLCSLVGQETLLILCLHMFLYMFFKTGAALLGLSAWLTKAVMVAGSLGILTAAGRAVHRRKERQRFKKYDKLA